MVFMFKNYNINLRNGLRIMEINEDEAVELINWIIRHKRTENGLTPAPFILEIFKKYDWIFNGYAYRGIKLYSWEEKDKRIMKKNKGNKIKYHPSKKYESWTLDHNIAVFFIIGNQPISLCRKIIDIQANKVGSHGIVIKGYIKNGLDINKALNMLETEAKKNGVIDQYLSNMLFFSEKEVLGHPKGLVQIVDKVNC